MSVGFLVEPAGAAATRTYGHCRGTTTSWHAFEASEVHVTGDTLMYKAMTHGETRVQSKLAEWTVLPLQSVTSLEEQTGTKAGQYAVLGGAAGLLGGALTALYVKVNVDVVNTDQEALGAEPTEVSPLVYVALVAGSAAVAALVGGVMGSSSEVYRTVRDKGQWLQADRSLSVQPFASGRGSSGGIALRITVALPR